MNHNENVYHRWEDTDQTINGWKNKKESIVFTNGCFDILHAGHIHYLNQAKSLADHLIIGLNSDRSVKVLKGSARPINKELDRATVLAALEVVDLVIIFDEDDPLLLIKHIMPDVLVKGGDWKIDQIIGASEVISNGGIVKSLGFLKGYSSTSIIEKLTDEN
jgi:rfaE bifunctional protein nucleotidyltransferase chain/domain